MWYVTSEFPKRLWPTMGLNSSHSTSKIFVRNGESNSPYLPHTTQRPMDKRSRLTKRSSISSRSGSRNKTVFGPTELLPVLPQKRLHYHSHLASRQSYMLNVAFHLQGICGSMKTQTRSCSTITLMQSWSPYRILPVESSLTLQQKHQSENVQGRGLGSTPSLPKYQRISY